MSDENKVRDSIDAVTGLVKDVPVYSDLAQPAAKELGKGLVTVAKAVNIALAPVGALVWGYEKCKDFIENKVSEKLIHVSSTHLTSPEPSIAVPAIQALQYTGYQTEIADMFANLLASSMTKDTASGVLPSFVEIIKQLSPDEAKLIKYFFTSKVNPLINIKFVNTGGSFEIIQHKLSLFGEAADCETISSVPIYLDNLVRLGIIYIPEDGYYSNDEHYALLENHPDVVNLIGAVNNDININQKGKIEIDKKMLSLTSYGQQFCKVCFDS